MRRTLRWLEEERPAYWHDQIKRRREQVAMARADVFRKQSSEAARLQPGDVRAEGSPAQGRGQPARRREAAGHGPEVAAALRHAVLEYHASVQRLKDLAAGDVPSARQLADPDHRRARGLSSGCAAVGPGPGCANRRRPGRRPRPSSSRSRPRSSTRARPPWRPKPRRDSRPRPRPAPRPRRPSRSTRHRLRVTMLARTNHRRILLDRADRGSAELFL